MEGGREWAPGPQAPALFGRGPMTRGCSGPVGVRRCPYALLPPQRWKLLGRENTSCPSLQPAHSLVWVTL